MSTREALLDPDAIETGKVLPFSVYAADGRLLLAQGQIVESERMCELLRTTGVSCSRTGNPQDAANALKEEEERNCPILRLSRAYAQTARRSMSGLHMAPSDSQEGYTTWVIGMHQRKSLILSHPVRPDKSLVPVLDGEQWVFRTFHATSVFRFTATVLKVSFEPFPHLHIDMPRLVDQRSVRKSPRAAMALVSEIKTATRKERCLVVDLSAQGARVATPNHLILAKGDKAQIELKLRVGEREYKLALDACIASTYGASDAQHPLASFYGLSFENLSDRDLLVLHGCVYERLASELDSLWQALSIQT
ncbi:MAG TPA: flagellar brake protein [Burkholderiales bacterium]|nr:flagellar brake protein [Burkholderiales bacterium]